MIFFPIEGFCQKNHDYFGLDLSLQHRFSNQSLFGPFKEYESYTAASYHRRTNAPVPFLIKPGSIDIGLGISFGYRYWRFSAKYYEEARRTLELIPTVRMYVAKDFFLEAGYYVNYFSYNNVTMSDTTSTTVAVDLWDKGFKSGVNIGLGYTLIIHPSMAFEPQLRFQFNNYSESAHGIDISDDLLTRIRLVLCFYLIHSR